MTAGSPAQPLRVLIVDDSAVVRQTLSSIEMNSQAEALQDAIAFFHVEEEQLPVMPSAFARPAALRRKEAGAGPVPSAPGLATGGAQRRGAGGREAVFQRPKSAVDDPEFQRF